jgi:hypothetical protein
MSDAPVNPPAAPVEATPTPAAPVVKVEPKASSKVEAKATPVAAKKPAPPKQQYGF